MRPLTPELAAMVRQGNAAPLLRLELIDHAPHYAVVYAGGPVGRNDAVLAPDGAVAQAYHDGARTAYARQVADPTGASWGSWAVVAPVASSVAGVAVARIGGRLRLLWQDAMTTGVYAAESTDGGRSWGAATLLFDPVATVCALAADGDAATVFAACQDSGGGQWQVAVWSPTGTGAWGGTTWTGGGSPAITGLDVARSLAGDGSYLVAVTRQPAPGIGAALQVCTYGAGVGAGWGAALMVVPPDLSAGVFASDPRVTTYDELYHLAYAVVDSGSVDGLPSTRAALLHSADGVHWSDPLEDAAVYAHGATPLKHAAGLLLVAPDTAALAPIPGVGTTSVGYRDCTGDISRLEVVHKDGDAARVVVTLQNRPSDGIGATGATGATGASAGTYGGLLALRPNALLRLWLGYAGAGLVPAYAAYVDDWSFVRAADEDEVVITASDAMAWLDRQSRGTLLYSGHTVEWLTREVAARAGLPAIVVPATAQFGYVAPTFGIPAGSTWRAALARLGRLYGFDVAVRVGADGSDVLTLYERQAAEAAVWGYGGEVEQLVVAVSADRANHVLVFGAPAAGTTGTVIGEAWDWADVAATGQERYLHTVEPLIGTRAGAEARAGLELAREARQGRGGSLSVPLHPGLEVGDVITATVTDGAAPVTLRVATLHHVYEPRVGTYDTILTCEGP